MRHTYILGIALLMGASARPNAAVAQTPRGLLARPNAAVAQDPAPPEVIFDPNLVAPDVQTEPPNSNIWVDRAHRIHFKSDDAISRYFAHWVNEDNLHLSRAFLVHRVLEVAYGNWWIQTPPTTVDIQRYRHDLNNKIWWLFLPTISAGATNVIGTTTTTSQMGPTTMATTSTQPVYTFSWKLGESLFARPSTKETAEAYLATEYKMRSEVLKSFIDIYSARRSAQNQLRTNMLDYLSQSSSDRAKELLKSMDALRTDIIKSNSQLDIIADGAATTAYSSYANFVP